MAKAQRDQPATLGLAHAPDKWLEDTGAGSPGDVKTRHRVAVLRRGVPTPLGPSHNWKETNALGVQPGAFLTRGPGEVILGPTFRPVIFVAIEAGAAKPVLSCELVRITYSEPALLWRIHKEQSAQRPERLSTERVLRLLIDDDRSASRVGDFPRADKAAAPAADNDAVRVEM